MPTSQPQHAGRRLLAVLGAAALGVGAFAPSAAAQTPTPVNVDFDFPSPIETSLGFPYTGVIDIEFGDDFEPGAHELTATLTVDIGSDDFSFRDLDDVCVPSGDHRQLVCTVPEAEASEHIDFEYGAYIRAVTGFYDYALTIAVDGETVETLTGEIEILGDHPAPRSPYWYGDVEYDGVEPGSTVEVAPEFLQQDPLHDDAAAVIVVVRGPEYAHDGTGPTTEAVAAYDNCLPDRWAGARGVACVVTDFENLPGTAFTFSDPVSFRIGEDAPGPFAVCGCTYSVFTVEAATLEDEFGDLTWDPNSDNLFGLQTVGEPESEFHVEDGSITIRTTQHPYDLAVEDVTIKGAEGDRVEVVTAVANEGPASAYGFFGGPGSYVLIGELPEGVELHWLQSDTGNVGELFCIEEADWDGWAAYLPGVDPSGLDFACFFSQLAAGSEFEFRFTVDIIDARSNDKGRLEVVALDDDGFPGVADADLTNNTAVVKLNGNGSGQLPKTGTSFTMLFGIAALVLVAGAVLLAVTSRRRQASAREDTVSSTDE